MPSPLDFIRQLQLGVGNDPLALRGDIAPDPMAVLHTMGRPQPPAALPENIPAPPGMFGMGGDRADALAMGVQNYLQSLGQINPRNKRGDQNAEAFLRGLAGSLSGMRVAEMGQREEKKRRNIKTNEDNQQDYREQSRTWGQQGFALRRDAAERKAQAERDAAERKAQAERDAAQQAAQARRDSEQRLFDATQGKLGHDYRMAEIGKQASGQIALEDARGRNRPPKRESYVSPVTNSLKVQIRALGTQIRREYNKDQKAALVAERSDMIETALRDAFNNSPDDGDPRAIRYFNDFKSFANEVGYANKWEEVVGLKAPKK